MSTAGTKRKSVSSDGTKVSSLTRLDHELDEMFGELRTLLGRSDRDLWAASDIILEMRRKYHLQDKVIAEHIGNCSPQRVGQLRKTAELFPAALRDAGISYSVYEAARRANNGGPNRQPKSGEEIASAIHAGNQTSRNITRWLETQREDDFAQTRSQQADRINELLTSVIRKVHHCAWESIVDDIAPRTLDAVWADPPYGAHQRDDDRRVWDSDSSRAMSGAANATHAKYMETTLALFDHLREKMRPEAPLYLLQHGGCVDNPLINIRARKLGWHFHTPVTVFWVRGKATDPSKWDDPRDVKGKVAPNNMGLAYASVCTRILIATQSDEPLRVTGCKYAGNVVCFPSASIEGAAKIARGQASRCDHHVYEHTPDLVTELLHRIWPKYSRHVCFEPFGCTAPASVAAIQNGWEWIYSETHQDNYELGQRRIAAALEARAQQEDAAA
ncbi:hypothetical protein HED60_05610 [Planctomycetales bacterium ZRK34]|nr:hypothetical protein HED60_05610 [Planctomycetales bacterium ZRK34]